MKKIFMLTKSPLTRLAAALIIGILLGAAGTVALIGHHLDEHHLTEERMLQQIDSLKQELTTAEEARNKLEQNLASAYEKKVEKVEVIVKLKDKDEFSKLELEKLLVDKLNEIYLGRPLDELDPLTLSVPVDDRIFQVERKNYRVKVSTTIVTETITMVVSASEIDAPSASNPL